jgi:SET domain-containing protein
VAVRYQRYDELKRFLQVKRSVIAGRGLFTARRLAKGETIFRGGRREGCYLIRHLNHSCRPNAKFIEKNPRNEYRDLFVALRTIRPGEELTFDFRRTRWADRYWPIVQKKGCRCPSCAA